MSQHHTSIRDLTGNPHLERLELADIGARNVQDSDAFDHVSDEMTDAEIDRLYVEEMTRRDKEAERQTVRGSAPAGWRDAVCVGCSAALHVPEDAAGDTLCPACERLGNALADDDDSDPTRPGGAALHPDYGFYVERLSDRRYWPDNMLIIAIDNADRGEGPYGVEPYRGPWLHAATNEVLRRLAA